MLKLNVLMRFKSNMTTAYLLCYETLIIDARVATQVDGEIFSFMQQYGLIPRTTSCFHLLPNGHINKIQY